MLLLKNINLEMTAFLETNLYSIRLFQETTFYAFRTPVPFKNTSYQHVCHQICRQRVCYCHYVKEELQAHRQLSNIKFYTKLDATRLSENVKKFNSNLHVLYDSGHISNKQYENLYID